MMQSLLKCGMMGVTSAKRMKPPCAEKEKTCKVCFGQRQTIMRVDEGE